MKAVYSLSLVALSTVLLAGCVEQERPAPGKYTTTSERTDANGTTYKTDKTTNIQYDKNGKMIGSVDTTTTSDPKGLMNKSTTETSKAIK